MGAAPIANATVTYGVANNGRYDQTGFGLQPEAASTRCHGNGITVFYGVVIYAFGPEWALPQIAKFAHREEYTILVRHWGIMVGLMGVFIVVAAFRENWRNPILIYSGVEKAFMVYVVLANLSQPCSQGFWFPAAMDAAVVLYTIAYFAVYGFNRPISVDSRSRLA